MRNVRFPRLAAMLLVLISLAACNSQEIRPDDPKSHDFSALGDPAGRLEYATAIPSASKQESVMRGDSALANGDRKRALFEYIDALGKGGADADLLYKVGRIHLDMGNEGQAELAFRLALSANADDVASLQELALMQVQRREFDGARSNLRRVIGEAPRAVKAHNALGVIADMDAEHAQAQQHYAEALRWAPGSPVYLNNLGYSHYLSGDLGLAERYFTQALDRQPSYERAWRNLALVYAKSGRYAEALNAFRKTGKDYEAYNDLGYVVMLKGDYDRASQFLEEAIRLSPTYYELADRNRQRLQLIQTGHAVD
jgi:Flp pilus assembly protein TadD